MAFAPFLLSLIGVAVILQNIPTIAFFIVLIVSLLSFLYGIYILWASLSVLIEVTEIIGTIKKEKEEKIIELLSSLVEKSGADSLFIKEKEVQAKFNNKYLKKDEGFVFSVNKKYDIPISINNASDKMAKKVEVGLIFPKDFLIENTSNFSIFTTEKDQIIRFNNEVVQAHESFIKGKIGITFLGVDEYKIYTFIKGENVKYYNFNFKIKVID
ncbi:MAG: hypothetical protein Q7R99_04125 [bacterium]|nr:hypothetical protein [bacterium]